MSSVVSIQHTSRMRSVMLHRARSTEDHDSACVKRMPEWRLLPHRRHSKRLAAIEISASSPMAGLNRRCLAIVAAQIEPAWKF